VFLDEEFLDEEEGVLWLRRLLLGVEEDVRGVLLLLLGLPLLFFLGPALCLGVVSEDDDAMLEGAPSVFALGVLFRWRARCLEGVELADGVPPELSIGGGLGGVALMADSGKNIV
jgi:hypothetical protein